MSQNTWTRQVAEALRLLAAAIEAKPAADSEPEGYTSANYPHGPKSFRRHIARGMKAIKVGKGYWVARDDAESYWATLRHKPSPAPKSRPANDDEDEAIRRRLEKAGISLRRAS